MKLKTRALPPAQFEFELESSKTDIIKWLNKTLDFLKTTSDYEQDKFSLKLSLNELGRPIQVLKLPLDKSKEMQTK